MKQQLSKKIVNFDASRSPTHATPTVSDTLHQEPSHLELQPRLTAEVPIQPIDSQNLEQSTLVELQPPNQ
jgi:hypothetical protein